MQVRTKYADLESLIHTSMQVVISYLSIKFVHLAGIFQ